MADELPLPIPQPHRLRRMPRELRANGVMLSDAGLLNSIRIVGGPGSGKSRLAARTLSLQRLIRGKPTLVLDPTGALFANICDAICRLPERMQEVMWQRVRYVDMAAEDFVVPMPLYWRRRPDETLLTTANRPLEVFKRLDPHLQSASVEGWNAVYEGGTAAGMMAAALGLQVTEIADMLRHPQQWKQQFNAAYRQYPDELEVAYAYFQELKAINNPELRKRRTSSFLIKLIPFLADPVMQATFVADRQGLDIAHEMAQGHLVIYDFQGEHDAVRRRMKLLWTFLEHVEFAKMRGPAGRGQPTLYIIDEITQLLGQNPLEQAIMADDLNELITVVARNYGFPVCLLHQNLSQLDERTQVSLAQIGTQIVGWLQEPADCLRLAQQFFQYNPMLERKREPVWMNLEYGVGPDAYSAPTVIDYTTTEFGIEEQLYLLADRFRAQGRFHFLVRLAAGEGALTQHLQPMSIARLHAGQYPNVELVNEVRRRLRKRDGIAVATLLAQIAARRQARITVQSPKLPGQSKQTPDDTIKQEPPHHDPTTHDPIPPSPASDTEAEAVDTARRGAEDEGWKNDLFSKTR